MKNSNFETLVKPVIVLVVICIITSAALAFTNSVTAPIIEEQEIAAANAAYQAVLPEADSFTAVAFDTENVVDAVKADNGAGYCIKANGKGYGGAVPVVVGFDADGKIVGVQFMQNSESAGFGMKLWDGNAEGVAYAEAMVGKDSTMTLREDGVNGITGATISSKAALSAVNTAIECFAELNAKEAA